MVAEEVILRSSTGDSMTLFIVGEECSVHLSSNSPAIGYNTVSGFRKFFLPCLKSMIRPGNKSWTQLFALEGPHCWAYAKRKGERIHVEVRDGDQKPIKSFQLKISDAQRWMEQLSSI